MNFKKYHVSRNLFDKNSNTTNDKGQVRPGVMISQGIYSINNTTGRAIYYRIGNEGTTIQINGGGKAENILANDDLYVWQGIREYGVMLNLGSEALPYEPYGDTWHDTPHYIHKTATDTITTLPAVIYANDNNATVGLKGNTVQQSGTTTVPSKSVTVSSLESGTNYALFPKADFPNAVVGDTINIVVSGTSYSQKVMKIDASYVYIENRTV